MAELQSLSAESWGVESGYHDVFGHWHATPLPTAEGLVTALSAGAARPRGAELAQTPERAFQGDGKRRWGIAVQLYSLRSARNWGIGDFTDLAAAIRVAGEAGASAIGLNPLHALHLDGGIAPSPYAPSSRLFLNPLYIDVGAIPEFDAKDIPDLDMRAAALRDVALVDYPGVTKLKLQGLRAAFAKFSAVASRERIKCFEEFCAARGEALAGFAAFNILRARHGPNWREWPQQIRAPNSETIAALRGDPEFAFQEFLQFEAHRQLERCKFIAREAGLATGLYLDVAVGVDPNGADAWAYQSTVLGALRVGAPPDQFNPAGQDWGLAPLNPHTIADNDFTVFRDILAAAMRHAGAIRLDHVLGLMRLYMIPPGASGRDGAYVRYPFAAMLRVVAEESRRHRCVVIGEDLGTVPDGFRDTMAQWGLWSYRVVMFERGHGGVFKSPHEYPPEALATFNTHDLATFRGWMSGADLLAKREIGVDPGESTEERGHSRDALRAALAAFGAKDNFAGIAAFLAVTPSQLVMVAIEDLLGVVEQVNVPGTIDEHPNWRRKLPLPVEAWSGASLFGETVEALRRAGR